MKQQLNEELHVSLKCENVVSPLQIRQMVDAEMERTLYMWPELNEGKVPTREFLHCCNLVVRFIDGLGIAFLPVSRDVSNNTRTVMTRFMQDRDKSACIEDILDNDISKNSLSTAEALLWLKRGLNFLCTFLQTFTEDFEAGVKTESIGSNLRRSYESTLCPYHGVILRQLFNVLCAAAPSRSQLLHRLSVIVEEHDPEKFILQIKQFHLGLRINLDALYAFYAERNLFQ